MTGARKLAIRPSLKWVQGMSKEDEDEWKQLVESCCTGPMARRSRGDDDALDKEQGVGDRDEHEEEVIEAGEEIEAEQEDGFLEADQRKVKKVQDPRLPSEEGVKEHFVSGHMPYRSWCHHCVRGRGREREHQRKDDWEPRGILEYHLDYCENCKANP